MLLPDSVQLHQAVRFGSHHRCRLLHVRGEGLSLATLEDCVRRADLSFYFRSAKGLFYVGWHPDERVQLLFLLFLLLLLVAL